MHRKLLYTPFETENPNHGSSMQHRLWNRCNLAVCEFMMCKVLSNEKTDSNFQWGLSLIWSIFLRIIFTKRDKVILEFQYTCDNLSDKQTSMIMRSITCTSTEVRIAYYRFPADAGVIVIQNLMWLMSCLVTDHAKPLTWAVIAMQKVLFTQHKGYLMVESYCINYVDGYTTWRNQELCPLSP